MANNAGAFDTFERMKNKVDEEEARAEAAEEMATDGDASLDKEFAELEKSSVDDELASLKAQMSGGAVTQTDAELDALKAEVNKEETKPAS